MGRLYEVEKLCVVRRFMWSAEVACSAEVGRSAEVGWSAEVG